MEKIIDYKGVELHRKELIVLKNVDFTLEEGEFVYLIGKVGSGKSSLLKSMYAEIPVAAGHAEVLGYDLRTLRRRDIPMLRRKIGIVFQDFQLLTDRSVYDNLRFVLDATGWNDRHEIDARIEEVLTEVGMLTKSYKMPHELSGGEQQRIVIARALLNRPRLILADEPTGNLDPATSEQIVNRLREISRKGTAVVMATHNLGLVEEMPGRVLKCERKGISEFA
ncbi:ATP-binding cassette domain-containing protein [Paramuribaculum intestinale]|jgi:cell division transport system ATP-binding protein|uniref:Cell division ATP-binding protein FtsE n=1 Tax=Paramuribaculum intestinale TaxID=2094151 RepID=A0A2V1IZX4_9BACT|nr:ATP-binding cassette domain-containing protein [Paramuribaculum intestinale]MBJ2185329.1 ATP-binding cassette domain-containing protein [Muribaculaceae bacterium]ROS94156.1 ATP-binding cassette domain-containing protein [Muribaculaceae bacterium Isolate-043 (Harlan)]ROT13944.1 ATP-binding cassette domain-containing protein [Muribaculaceae bacterium Isolate-105 (HZI)]RXE62264.1 ATP-binding cassette domain-containing protein [Muribaculaceae bacterium Isolate-004 (NCI)]PWB09708.1 phosphonate A